jgi:lipopolysaccharide transport protein LptA
MRKSLLLFLPLVFVSTVIAEIPEQLVNITGERMEVLDKGAITRFLGNVKLVKGKDIITSDVMEHYEKKNFVIGKGNIHFTAYPGESITLEAFSNQLTYDINNKESILTGSPRLIRTEGENYEDRVKIEGKVIKLFGKEKRVYVEGDARVEYKEITATGKFLDYNYETKEIVLYGDSPHINQNNEQVKGDYSAEVITIFIDEERIIMEGNVEAFIYPKNR